MKTKKIIILSSLGLSATAIAATSVVVSQSSVNGANNIKASANEIQDPIFYGNNESSKIPLLEETMFGGHFVTKHNQMYKNYVKLQETYNSMKAALEHHVWELKRHTPNSYLENYTTKDVTRLSLTNQIAESYGLKGLVLNPAAYGYYYSTRHVSMHGLDYLQFKIEVQPRAWFRWDGPNTIPSKTAIFEIPLSNRALLTLNKNQDELEDQVEILQSLEIGVNYALSDVETENKVDQPLTEAILNKYGAENILSKILDYDRFTYRYSTKINPPENFSGKEIKTTTLSITITDKESNDKITTEIEVPMTVGSYYLLDVKNKFKKEIERGSEFIRDSFIIRQSPISDSFLRNVVDTPFTIFDAAKFGLSDFPFSEDVNITYTYTATEEIVNGDKYYSVNIYASSALKDFKNILQDVEIGNIHIPLSDKAENTMLEVFQNIQQEKARIEDIQVTTSDVLKDIVNTSPEEGKLEQDDIDRLGLDFIGVNLANPNLYYTFDKVYAIHHGLPFYEITLKIFDTNHDWISSKLKLLIPLSEEGVSYARFTRNYHPDLVSFLQTQVNMEAKRIAQFNPTSFVQSTFSQVRDMPFDETISASLGIKVPLNKSTFRYTYDLVKVDENIDEVRINVYNGKDSNYKSNAKFFIIHNQALFNKINPSQIEASRLALSNPNSVLKNFNDVVDRKYFNQIVANQFNLGDLNLDTFEFNYSYSYFPIGADRGKLIIYVSNKDNPNVRSEAQIDIATSDEYFMSHAQYIVEYSGIIDQVIEEADRVSDFSPSNFRNGTASEIKNGAFHQSDADWFNLSLNGKPLTLDEERFNYFYDQKVISNNSVEVSITIVNKINSEIQFKTRPFIMPLIDNITSIANSVRSEVSRLVSFDRTGWQASEPSERNNVEFKQHDATWFGFADLQLNPSSFIYTFDQHVFNDDLMYVIIYVASRSNPEIKSQFGFLMPLKKHLADI